MIINTIWFFFKIFILNCFTSIISDLLCCKDPTQQSTWEALTLEHGSKLTKSLMSLQLKYGKVISRIAIQKKSLGSKVSSHPSQSPSAQVMSVCSWLANFYFFLSYYLPTQDCMKFQKRKEKKRKITLHSFRFVF